MRYTKMKNGPKTLESIPKPSDRSKNGMKYCTAISRWSLTFVGIWPHHHQVSLFERIMTATQIAVCYSLILFIFIPCALHTVIDEKSTRKRLKLTGPLIYYLSAFAKYSFLVTRKNDIRQCLDHVFNDWRQDSSFTDHEIMMKYAGVSRFITGICATCVYGSGIFFRLIIPLFGGKRVGHNNITVRPLGTPIYKPLFTADDSPSYEIVFTMQTMSSIVIANVMVGAASLASALVLHACAQLNVVMSRLNSFVGESEHAEDILDDRMAEMIELHSRVLNFIARTDSLLNKVCLVEFIASMVNICLMVYSLMMEIEQAETIAIVGYCVIVISFTFNIFILCYIGEMLAEQGKKVGSTAYMIDWYKLPGKNAKGLILLLAMTNYPCRITAGKMAELSYKGFSGVLKTSMGYLNLLHQIAQ